MWLSVLDCLNYEFRLGKFIQGDKCNIEHDKNAEKEMLCEGIHFIILSFGRYRTTILP